MLLVAILLIAEDVLACSNESSMTVVVPNDDGDAANEPCDEPNECRFPADENDPDDVSDELHRRYLLCVEGG